MTDLGEFAGVLAPTKDRESIRVDGPKPFETWSDRRNLVYNGCASV